MSLKETFGAASRSSASLRLELLAVLLGHEADVEERQDLAELHRGALHRPQRGDDLLGGLELAALERVALALLVAGQVGRPRAELARGLPGGEAGDARGARDARGGDAVLRHRAGWCQGVGVGLAAGGADCGAGALGAGVARGASAWACASRSASASGCAPRSSYGVFVGVGVCALLVAGRRRAASSVEERGRVAVAPPILLPASSWETVTNDDRAHEGEHARWRARAATGAT